MRWQTDESSSTEVVVMGDSDQSFWGAACVGNPCQHEVRLTGLSIGQELTFFLRSKDLALNSFESEDLRVTTIDLPDVSITEVLAASGRDPDNSGNSSSCTTLAKSRSTLEGGTCSGSGAPRASTFPKGPVSQRAVISCLSVMASPWRAFRV